MNNNTMRVSRVEIIDCQEMTSEELDAKIESLAQSTEDETGVIKLLMTSPAKATLTDKEGNNQHLLLEVSGITDLECASLCENLSELGEAFPDLLIELRRTKTIPTSKLAEHLPTSPRRGVCH